MGDRIAEPLRYAGVWCNREYDKSTQKFKGSKILSPPNVFNHSIMMPFAGYREKYEVCTPSIWFGAFALVTPSDYDYIKAQCDFSTKTTTVVVFDPYDEYYNIPDYNYSALPPNKTRLALRYSPYQFAPGDVYTGNLGKVVRIVRNPWWSLIDFDPFIPVVNDSYGRNYDSSKCKLKKGKI